MFSFQANSWKATQNSIKKWYYSELNQVIQIARICSLKLVQKP